MHNQDTECHHKNTSKIENNISSDTIYTCPMHPEIRQVGPGFCKICGMTLEPEKVVSVLEEDHELIDMNRRFWITALLSLSLLNMNMSYHFLDEKWLHKIIMNPSFNWV